ncbi:MAG: hypothetical protein JST30_12150 [Armatimonadetes bacterium]|nr:hypothetical protein [Armatimonadota bacterium]
MNRCSVRIVKDMMLAALAAAVLEAPVLEIGLQPVQAVCHIGEKVLFRAPIKNVGKTSVRIVIQGDSMQEGRKAPLCQVQFRPVGTLFWKVPQWEAGCGNTNPARVEDFLELKPGKSVDLLGGMAWSEPWVSKFSDSPGDYEFRVVYDTTKPLTAWIGGPLTPADEEKAVRELRPYYEQVPKGIFTSTSVRIRLVR